ncbi:phosphopantetheine-binding protein [Kitasatospora viridis]|uniref:Phosphopantetheine binding protein n=1 Tax=Kitasatospora viridis TaxID=281105 RepID=A0A561UHV6_9ACTN|nr:phosphopantetheine-binding protein [Kitasatospora viridis]TWF98947.1 phosphopantetheine binding protein [Kitasatospora viridis]
MSDPGDELEASLTAIWRRCLAVDRVGPDDDFLDLGGDSLGALAVLAELELAHGVPVDVFELMMAPTVRELAAVVRAKSVGGP